MKKEAKEEIAKNKNLIRNLKKRVSSLEQGIEDQIKSDVTPAIVASFGFIIALVWRDAIREALNHYLESTGLMGSVVLYNFISAVIVTIVVIAIMMSVSKYGRSKRIEKITSP